MLLSALTVVGVAGVAAWQMPKTASPAAAKAYIISPKNGDTVGSPFTVQFGLKGMGVAPAGVTTAADTPTGHHHLLIDVATMPNMDMPLPMSDTVRHFGKGQTEAELTLPAGRHTLQLVLGDATHTPHDKPVVSDKITITVK